MTNDEQNKRIEQKENETKTCRARRAFFSSSSSSSSSTTLVESALRVVDDDDDFALLLVAVVTVSSRFCASPKQNKTNKEISKRSHITHDRYKRNRKSNAHMQGREFVLVVGDHLQSLGLNALATLLRDDDTMREKQSK
jgi:hypothetical protein